VSGHKPALHMADTSDRRNNADLSIVFPSRDAARAAQTPIATAVPRPKGSKPMKNAARYATLQTLKSRFYSDFYKLFTSERLT
jgi:hypothetical protein